MSYHLRIKLLLFFVLVAVLSEVPGYAQRKSKPVTETTSDNFDESLYSAI